MSILISIIFWILVIYGTYKIIQIIRQKRDRQVTLAIDITPEIVAPIKNTSSMSESEVIDYTTELNLQGNHGQSVTMLRGFLTREPNSIPVLEQLAFTLSEIDGKEQETIQCAQDIIKRDPMNAIAYWLSGKAYYMLESDTAAERFYKLALQMDKKQEDAMQGLAIVYYIQKKYIAVKDLGERLAGTNKPMGLHLQAIAYVGMATESNDPLPNQAYLNEALKLWSEEIQLEPEHMRTYIRKARVLAALRRIPEAFMLMDQAERLLAHYPYPSEVEFFTEAKADLQEWRGMIRRQANWSQFKQALHEQFLREYR